MSYFVKSLCHVNKYRHAVFFIFNYVVEFTYYPVHSLVTCCSLNPNWFSGISFPSSNMDLILFNNNFSTIFDNVIRRYDSTRSWSFSGFGSQIIWEPNNLGDFPLHGKMLQSQCRFKKHSYQPGYFLWKFFYAL